MKIPPGNRPGSQITSADPAQDFAELYDAEMPRVYRYISYHVGSIQEAEDLTADVFQRALLKWPQMHQELDSPRAWVMTIASNRLTDHFRKEKNRSEWPIAFDLAEKEQDPEEVAMNHNDVEGLLDRLLDLPDRERTVLTLRFAADLSHREIAQVLGISETASGVALMRGLRRLRQAYEGEEQ